MTALAEQINNGPGFISLLKMLYIKPSCFRPAQSATKKNGQDRVIALAAKLRLIRGADQLLHLLSAKPVTQPDSESRCALNAPNTGCKIGAE